MNTRVLSIRDSRVSRRVIDRSNWGTKWLILGLKVNSIFLVLYICIYFVCFIDLIRSCVKRILRFLRIIICNNSEFFVIRPVRWNIGTELFHFSNYRYCWSLVPWIKKCFRMRISLIWFYNFFFQIVSISIQSKRKHKRRLRYIKTVILSN